MFQNTDHNWADANFDLEHFPIRPIVSQDPMTSSFRKEIMCLSCFKCPPESGHKTDVIGSRRTPTSFVNNVREQIFLSARPILAFHRTLFLREKRRNSQSTVKTTQVQSCSSGPWKLRNTLCDAGVSPSAPTAARDSNNDLADAFAAAHDRIAQNSTRVDTRDGERPPARHRTSSTVSSTRKNAEPPREKARAPAMAFRNSTASWLHLPPVSKATTTNPQRSPQRVPDVFAFCLGVLMQNCSVGLCCALGCQRASKGDVNRQLCAVKSAGQHFNRPLVHVTQFRVATAFATCIGDIKWEAQSLYQEGAEGMWFHNGFWLGRSTTRHRWNLGLSANANTPPGRLGMAKRVTRSLRNGVNGVKEERTRDTACHVAIRQVQHQETVVAGSCSQLQPILSLQKTSAIQLPCSRHQLFDATSCLLA